MDSIITILGEDNCLISDYIWAKKSEKDGKWEWLSLTQHLIDTRCVTSLLWQHWLTDGQKQIVLDAINSINDLDGQKLAEFLALTHDAGKSSPSFILKRGHNNSYDFDKYLVEKLEDIGFRGLSNTYLQNPNESPHSLAGQYILKKFGIKDDISSIVGSHHGKPIDVKSLLDKQESFESNYYQFDTNNDSENKQVIEKWKQAQREILEWALSECDYKSIDALPRVKLTGQVILSGLLIMADWIASNTIFFPLLDTSVNVVSNQSDRSRYGWSNWFETRPINIHSIDDINSLYQDRFGFDKPNSVQKTMFDTLNNIDKPGLFILEAPMGVGKTEAALIGAEQLAYKFDRSGIFMGLPTQATCNGIFSRIRGWSENISECYYEDISIQLVHGKAKLNSDYTNLNMYRLQDEYDNSGNVISNSWFTRRKTAMLDDVVIGTVDNFLLTSLKQKHLFLRHLGLSKKVVIIDEVHAYDAYMSEYLETSIKWMGAYNVPVILLSATLPADSRVKYAMAYLRGQGKKKRDIKNLDGLRQLTNYPLITYTNGSSINKVINFPESEIKSVRVERLEKDCIEDTVKKLTDGGGIVGIIVNTVKMAQELALRFVEMFDEDTVILLHSNFIATDRLEKESNLINIAGKKAERPQKKIIIGTQVIEQSLDIDFDVLISELAPMDLLLQRIGRLHRHKIERPTLHRDPIIYVIGTSEEYEFDEGTKYVYGSYLLAQTQACLPNIIDLPSDISPLVQKVYGEELAIESDKLKLFKKEFEKKKTKKKEKAKTYLLGNPDLSVPSEENNVSLIGWLKNTHPQSNEEYGYAQVRDVEEIIEVIVIKKCEKGYSFFDESEDISDKIDDKKIAIKLSKATVRLPHFYDETNDVIRELEKFNIEVLPEWQENQYLKGALGLMFDENNDCKIHGITLHYDKKYGMSMLRKE